MNEHRAITLRSNRFLGSALVEKGLVVVTDLEAANEKFMAAMQSEDPQHASILTVLLHELKVLDENALIQHLYDEYRYLQGTVTNKLTALAFSAFSSLCEGNG